MLSENFDVAAAAPDRRAKAPVRRRPSSAVLPPLYRYYWPPVTRFETVDQELQNFVDASIEEQERTLIIVRHDREVHGRFVHHHLSSLYTDCFGYRDSPATVRVDDNTEVGRFRARLLLERELLNHWLDPGTPPQYGDQRALADYLEDFSLCNRGVDHPLFRYLRDEATRGQLELFLQWELIRNEIVDDEVALLVVGLQGMMKAVAAANLWDECGRGNLDNFHTYWLRRLLTAANGWDQLEHDRQEQPWFAKITSNVFASLLTRPSRKLEAYGAFLVFESWVEAHFRALLEGMSRVGLTSDDEQIYFTAHVAIDPRHGRNLADALRAHQPSMNERELHQVALGASVAVDAGTRQYDYVLKYLRSHVAAVAA